MYTIMVRVVIRVINKLNNNAGLSQLQCLQKHKITKQVFVKPMISLYLVLYEVAYLKHNHRTFFHNNDIHFHLSQMDLVPRR